MRSKVLAIAATLLVGVATPVFAEPSYNACLALSMERGVAPGQGSLRNPDDQHNAFMRQCLAGQIPLPPLESSFASARSGRARR